MARIFNTVIHARDPYSLAEFWIAALDYVVTQRQPGLVRISPKPAAATAGPNLLFLEAADVPTRSVMHLDLAVSDPTDEVQRLQQLGAKLVDPPTEAGSLTWRTANDIQWIVLLDPEGNEFCLGSEPGD